MAKNYKEPSIEIEPLETLYNIRQEEEVSNFLNKYLYLVPVLVATYDKIKAHFSDSKLSLEVITDPETPKHSHLVIWIGTRFNPVQAMDKLDQLVENWFLKLPNRVLGKVPANLEFL